MLSEVFQNYQILPLQRYFEGRRINISMTHHLFPLVADMLADFILYPASDELRQSPDDPLVLATARRAVTLFFYSCKLRWPSTGMTSHSTASIAIGQSAGSIHYRTAGPSDHHAADIVQHRDLIGPRAIGRLG